MIKRQERLNSNAPGYRMLIPACIFLLIINTIPFFYGLVLSFTNKDIYKPNIATKFIGIENYIKAMSSSDFLSILGFTLVYTITSVLLSYVLGMVFALLLNREIKGRNIFRGIALIPWVMASSAVVISWRWMLNDQFGIINIFLQQIGLIKEPIHFFSDPLLAKITVIMFAVWKGYPFQMIMLLGGLQSIGKEMYEPAVIDGANKWQCFRYITLPLLKPVSIVTLTLQFIWTFNTNSFDNIYLLTKGGPVKATYVLSIDTYNAAFFKGKTGYASAISLIMTVFIAVVYIIYIAAKKVKESKENEA